MRQMESALALRGIKVTIFNLGAGRPSGANVVNFDTERRLRQFFQLWRAFAGSDSDLFHYLSASYRSFWLGALCILLARLSGKKIVVSFVGGALKGFVDSLGPVQRRLASASLNLCHALVACNEDIEYVLAGLVPNKKVWRMSNCFPLLEGEGGAVPDRVNDFVRSHTPLVCATGAASPEYGLIVAVEALKLLRERRPGAGLLVAMTKYGEPGYEAELLSKIASLGLREHVLIQRDLPDFVSVMKRSSVFLRSTMVDGDSISVREALFLGLPAVVSDTPFRPGGVIQFRKGDAVDMAEKLGLAIQPERRTSDLGPQEESRGNLEVLLEVYGSVLKPSRGLDPADPRHRAGRRSGFEV
jgi:glycosyltransferase involved in cell wall biosynthesis